MYKIWVKCFGQLQLAFNTPYFRFNNFQYTGKYVLRILSNKPIETNVMVNERHIPFP
jgi:hypothetical protein